MSWNLRRQVEAAYRQGQRPSALDSSTFDTDAAPLAEEAVEFAVEKGKLHASGVLRRSAWGVAVRSNGTPRQYEAAFQQATVALDLVYSANTVQTLAFAP
jgi:DNA segregation ATPase FtsK/SpoIIIE-like protein